MASPEWRGNFFSVLRIHAEYQRRSPDCQRPPNRAQARSEVSRVVPLAIEVQATSDTGWSRTITGSQRYTGSPGRDRPHSDHVRSDSAFSGIHQGTSPCSHGNGTWGQGGRCGGSGEEEPVPLLAGAAAQCCNPQERCGARVPSTNPPPVTNPRAPALELAGGLRPAERR